MIISHEHQFVFIHIPKCAGTSVRKLIRPFDSCEGYFTGQVARDSTVDLLDFGHIPLFSLREHFSSEFEAVQNYWSFAVVRDPFSRFASSVSQHLRKYTNQAIHERSREDIRTIIDKSIDYLSRQPRCQHQLPAEYIHFQKQVDYVDFDGTCMVSNLYSVNKIDVLLSDVSRRVGQELMEDSNNNDTKQANVTFVFKNDLLRQSIETSRPLTHHLSKVLPERIKQRIRGVVYVPRDKRFKDVFEADQVKAFIRDYYAADIALYQRVLEAELKGMP